MSEPAIVITYQVPAPGSVWVEEEQGQMSLVVTKDGAESPFQRVKTVKRRVEVTGATPRIVTRARVTYLEHGVVERIATSERARPSLIRGKSYGLDATSGTLAVTGDGGAALSAEEEAAVRDEEKRFGRAETLPMVVARLRYRAGEPVAVPAAAAAKLFPGDLEVTTMELTFVERGEGGARFQLRVAMNGNRAGIETRTEVVGTLRLDATAQPLEMKLVGPVHLTGAMVADGTLELVARRDVG